MSIEPVPTPSPKKEKILGLFTQEEASLGLGALATVGVAILGFLKLQDMNIIPKPPMSAPLGQMPPNGSRVTFDQPSAVTSTTPAPQRTKTLERDPLGPNVNSIAMDQDEDYIERKTRVEDRINAGY